MSLCLEIQLFQDSNGYDDRTTVLSHITWVQGPILISCAQVQQIARKGWQLK